MGSVSIRFENLQRTQILQAYMLWDGKHLVPDLCIVIDCSSNEAAASRILSELSKQNSTHKISFIKADVSLLRNVDTACEEISQKEKKVNFLFLSPGILAAKGRDGIC